MQSSSSCFYKVKLYQKKIIQKHKIKKKITSEDTLELLYVRYGRSKLDQEIEEILPEVVTTRDSGYKAVKYEKIVPFLIQCIKELKDEIEELKGAKTPKKTRKPRAKNKPE